MEINRTALLHNLKVLQEHAPHSKILAILKANAYGHGLVRIASMLENNVGGFGVACLSEAIYLRKAGVKAKIVVLNGAFTKKEYTLAGDFALDMVIHNVYQLKWLFQLSSQKPLSIWFKVNTGMNRLGFPLQQALAWIPALQNSMHVKSLVVMSHLSYALAPKHLLTHSQVKQFTSLVRATRGLKIEYSLVNSSGIFELPDDHYQWVRSGLGLYGVSESQTANRSLLPVMTLKSKVISIQKVKPGSWVGYEGGVRCFRSKKIGVVSFGYGDGYPRVTQARIPLLLHGCKVYTLGHISMDMLTIDLTPVKRVCVGDEVTLWGEGLDITDVASATQRSPYELLCGLQRAADMRIKIRTK